MRVGRVPSFEKKAEKEERKRRESRKSVNRSRDIALKKRSRNEAEHRYRPGFWKDCTRVHSSVRCTSHRHVTDQRNIGNIFFPGSVCRSRIQREDFSTVEEEGYGVKRVKEDLDS